MKYILFYMAVSNGNAFFIEFLNKAECETFKQKVEQAVTNNFGELGKMTVFLKCIRK